MNSVVAFKVLAISMVAVLFSSLEYCSAVPMARNTTVSKVRDMAPWQATATGQKRNSKFSFFEVKFTRNTSWTAHTIINIRTVTCIVVSVIDNTVRLRDLYRKSKIYLQLISIV